MKRLLCLLISLVITLCGCSKSDNGKELLTNSNDQYVIGVWMTYSELAAMLATNDFKSAFDAAADRCKDIGITDIFVHTRAFCDSLYKSEYFPLMGAVSGCDYDVFEYIIATCHNRGMRVHAWINPYRVRTADGDTTKLPADSPVTKWLGDDDASNDINVCISNGIYLNPASVEVRRLVVDSIRELTERYDVDGVHFDDYFYPTTDESFDSVSYTEYCNQTENSLPLDIWRRANVNALISASYTAIKFMDKDIIFSISPAASISRNYTESYADISAWMKSGCVDWIIPQLYFGFDYPEKEFQFDELLKLWKRAVGDNDVRLMIGLANYKIGTDSPPDKEEWAQGNDVIARQVEVCEGDSKVSGHIYFSYTALTE